MTGQEREPNDDRAPEYRRDDAWVRNQLAIAEGQRLAYRANVEAQREVRVIRHSHQCRDCASHYICQVQGDCDITDDQDDKRRQCTGCWADRRKKCQ